jgi:hypothetical protein
MDSAPCRRIDDDSAAGPLGDRRLHPRAAAQPERTIADVPPRERANGSVEERTDGRSNQPRSATGIARAQMPGADHRRHRHRRRGFGWFTNAAEFYRAWLPAFIFWFLIAAGSIGVMCLQYVTGGEWGVLIRRPLGAASRTIRVHPLRIPIVIGSSTSTSGRTTAVVAHDALLQQKQLWLNPSGGSSAR